MNVCCRKRAVEGSNNGLTNPSYLSFSHLQAAADAQRDAMTSSEPVYELEVDTSTPVQLMTADGDDDDDDDDDDDGDDGDDGNEYSELRGHSKTTSSSSPAAATDEYSVNATSPIYCNVNICHDELQQTDPEHVYGVPEPCNEAAYQALAGATRPPAAVAISCEYVSPSSLYSN